MRRATMQKLNDSKAKPDSVPWGRWHCRNTRNTPRERKLISYAARLSQIARMPDEKRAPHCRFLPAFILADLDGDYSIASLMRTANKLATASG